MAIAMMTTAAAIPTYNVVFGVSVGGGGCEGEGLGVAVGCGVVGSGVGVAGDEGDGADGPTTR